MSRPSGPGGRIRGWGGGLAPTIGACGRHHTRPHARADPGCNMRTDARPPRPGRQHLMRPCNRELFYRPAPDASCSPDRAAAWFADSLRTRCARDVDRASELFATTNFWRDLVAFHAGRPSRTAPVSRTCSARPCSVPTRPAKFPLDKLEIRRHPPARASPSSTAGAARAVLNCAGGELRAWTFPTQTGHEEPRGMAGAHTTTTTWRRARRRRSRSGSTVQPGAGHRRRPCRAAWLRLLRHTTDRPRGPTHRAVPALPPCSPDDHRPYTLLRHLARRPRTRSATGWSPTPRAMEAPNHNHQRRVDRRGGAATSRQLALATGRPRQAECPSLPGQEIFAVTSTTPRATPGRRSGTKCCVVIGSTVAFANGAIRR